MVSFLAIVRTDHDPFGSIKFFFRTDRGITSASARYGVPRSWRTGASAGGLIRVIAEQEPELQLDTRPTGDIGRLTTELHNRCAR
jgi:hypothetical protein